MDKVNFTVHAKKRFRERFPNVIKEYEGNTLLALAKSYYASKIDNSVKNNTKFMTYVYDKHGYEAITFSVNQNMIFLCKEERLITVTKLDGFGMSQLLMRNKSTYRKK